MSVSRCVRRRSALNAKVQIARRLQSKRGGRFAGRLVALAVIDSAYRYSGNPQRQQFDSLRVWLLTTESHVQGSRVVSGRTCGTRDRWLLQATGNCLAGPVMHMSHSVLHSLESLKKMTYVQLEPVFQVQTVALLYIVSLICPIPESVYP